jgi:hypothetical protein
MLYLLAKRPKPIQNAVFGKDPKPPPPSDTLPVEEVDVVRGYVLHVASFGLLEDDLVRGELQLPRHLVRRQKLKRLARTPI